MPEEEKKEIIVPMDDKAFKTASPGVPTDQEKTKFRALMEMYNVYSEDNPPPHVETEVGDIPSRLSDFEEVAISLPQTNQILQFDGARWVNRSNIIAIDAPTAITLTWDGAQNTLTLTTQTSARARWAFLSVKAVRTADFTDPFMWYTYAGNLIATIASNQIGGANYQISGFGILPLDSSQRIKYDAPASTTSRECYLYGYIEG